ERPRAISVRRADFCAAVVRKSGDTGGDWIVGAETMWLLYGASGYTGELIAREAARRGERPILAGRSAEKIEPLARELGCDWRAFDLEHIDLSGVQAVLHCAGPFSRTSEPMVRACLAAGVHYLDITGEIAVFESVMARNDEAV